MGKKKLTVRRSMQVYYSAVDPTKEVFNDRELAGEILAELPGD